jgi:RNA polymerase sigma-70 factor, ECF subfamily
VNDAADAVVIRRSLEHPRVFGEVFERHAVAVHRFLARRVGREAADDLLADTFRIAFERRVSFDTTRVSALPWLYGIARNLTRKHYEATARAQNGAALPHLSGGTATDPDRALDVATQVASLPDDERDVLVLFAWEDLSYEEIADVLDIPIGTVRSRLHRARSRLRRTIGSPVGGAQDHRVTNVEAPS